MILKCVCYHKYQDKKYGKKMRVHNPTHKGNKASGTILYRCTVCERERGEK